MKRAREEAMRGTEQRGWREHERGSSNAENGIDSRYGEEEREHEARDNATGSN